MELFGSPLSKCLRTLALGFGHRDTRSLCANGSRGSLPRIADGTLVHTCIAVFAFASAGGSLTRPGSRADFHRRLAVAVFVRTLGVDAPSGFALQSNIYAKPLQGLLTQFLQEIVDGVVIVGVKRLTTFRVGNVG